MNKADIEQIAEKFDEVAKSLFQPVIDRLTSEHEEVMNRMHELEGQYVAWGKETPERLRKEARKHLGLAMQLLSDAEG